MGTFGTKSLRRIMRYRWSYTEPNERLLHDTTLKRITCPVCQRKLQLHGHVAPFPEIDPTHRIVAVRESSDWRRPKGGSQNSFDKF